MTLLFLIVSFAASIIGSICGIGGGVLMKPLLDSFQVMSVASISFLSGCTVLTMSVISVVKNKRNGQIRMDYRISTPLALGAAAGGVCGKYMFQWISRQAAENVVGCVQAVCLMIVTAAALLYTVNRKKIRTLHMTNAALCAAIGLLLGIMSSFLGIGGGPINLVVLYYFFSMETKTAAVNSLYIIMFSQAASLLNTLCTGTVPEFAVLSLGVMVLGGILGGMLGSRINKTIRGRTVEKLFILIMLVIVGINIYNIIQFL